MPTSGLPVKVRLMDGTEEVRKANKPRTTPRMGPEQLEQGGATESGGRSQEEEQVGTEGLRCRETGRG